MVKKVMPEDRTFLLKRWLSDLGGYLLFWDLESSPNEGYWFNSSKPQFMSYKQIKKGRETKIITIQYMWEGDDHPSYLEWDKFGDHFDDSSMIEEFVSNVLRKYPQDKILVVGQNHKAFDHHLLNERSKVLRTTPPVHNMIKVDTFKHSKSSFNSASHSLDARSEQYGLGGKLKTDLDDWINVLESKTEPKDILIPYGLKDVLDLRSIFWNDLPYYESLPAPLEKILLLASAKCVKCEERKQSKYNLEDCKVDGKNGFKCLNCQTKFIL